MAQGKGRGRPPKKSKQQDQTPAEKLDAGMPPRTHLYVGPRDVKIPMEKHDFEKVLKSQQDLRREISESEEHLLLKQKQLAETEERRMKEKAEIREIEAIIEEAKDRILETIDANAGGFHIERMEVDEFFDRGEIVTFKKDTTQEVGQRRNAMPPEWAAAQEVRDEKGRPVSRFQKGKPADGRPGFVVIDGGKEGQKEVRATGDGMGYIGPTEDPKRKPKEDSKGKKKKEKKPREPKTLPTSLRVVDDDESTDEGGGDNDGDGPSAS